jgi:hypothetical protein
METGRDKGAVAPEDVAEARKLYTRGLATRKRQR